VLRENAQTERVLNEENAQAERVRNETVVVPISPQTTNTNTYPPLEIEECPEMDVGTLRGTPISYPEDKSTSSQPADNTRHQRKVQTITQDYLFHLMDTSFLPGQQLFTSKQASSWKYPLQFLCDFAYLVLEDKTGDLLKYSSTQSTRTCGANRLEKRSDDWQQSPKQ
jgi:hypothetical protein